jgi:hypothetical protein
VVYFFRSGFFKVELCEIFHKGSAYTVHLCGKEYRC